MSNNVNDSNVSGISDHDDADFRLPTQPSYAPMNENKTSFNLIVASSSFELENTQALHQDPNTDFKLAAPEQHTVLLTDGTVEQMVILTKDLYLIGRDVACDMRLHSGFVSRCHAHLRFRLHHDGHAYYEIIDGDIQGKPSKNGLLLDGNIPIKKHNLRHGDIITFAPEVHLLYLSPTSRHEPTSIQGLP
jgi:hypothetical protein